MRLTFAQVEMFASDWRRLRLTDEDLQALESMIMERPEAGPIMSGTGGLRKLRFAPPSWHTGKSGATRVCYVYFVKSAHCGLIAIFPKNEKSNLNAKEKSLVRKVIQSLRDAVAG